MTAITTSRRVTHRLPGLRAGTLAGYLAGLGLVRVLAAQSDAELSCWWEGDVLVVETAVSDLVEWLVTAYAPTPVLSPWNRGSGFGQEAKTPELALGELLAMRGDRLDELREAHAFARATIERLGRDCPKATLVRELRNAAPDGLVAWIDAALVLLVDPVTGEDDLEFPPLLGSGGNDGRLDFSTNFHQRLLDVLGPKARPAQVRDWAGQALFDVGSPRLVAAAVGQFDAFLAGSKNSDVFGAGVKLVNPWSYLLLVEGAMVFASGANRRLTGGNTRASMPFTVNSSGEGTGSVVASENRRGEIWAPLWDQPMDAFEVRQLFREGRARWDGRAALSGSDMYGAVRSLGVHHSIHRFVRFGILERNGTNHTASVLDRVDVRARPEVALVGPLSRRLDRIRSGAGSWDGALRAAKRTLVDFLRDPSPDDLVDLLATVTDLNVTLGRSAPEDVAPVSVYQPGLVDHLVASVGTPERSIALAVVSRSCQTAQGRLGLRRIVLPIADDDNGKETWGPILVPGLGLRPLTDILLEALWRVVLAGGSTSRPEGAEGIMVCDPSGWWAPPQAVNEWVAGDIDERLLVHELKAMLALPVGAWSGIRNPSRDTGVVLDPVAALAAALGRGLRSASPPDGNGTETAAGDVPTRGWDREWPVQARTGQSSELTHALVARANQTGWHIGPVRAPRDIGRSMVTVWIGPAWPAGQLARLDPRSYAERKLGHDQEPERVNRGALESASEETPS